MINYATILNIFFDVILFLYWAIVFIILYHLTRFGIGTQPKKFAVIFFFGSVILSTITIFLFLKSGVDLTAYTLPW